MKVMLLFLAFLAQIVHAFPERTLSQNWHNVIAPYFSQGQQRSFINPHGMKLNYHSFVSSRNKKTLVILPGRTEPAVKYAEVIYDLKNQGFNIYILDHQGQGASDKSLSDSQKGHVKFFIHYVRDFSKWLEEVVLPETADQEHYLLAHSMGGTIATLYLAYGNPVFKKVVLSAPMMELNTKPYTEEVARVLSGALTLGFQGTKYAPDRGPYIASEDKFEKNEVTHSRVRFEMAKAIFTARPDYVVAGPTNRWVHQSLITTRRIDNIAEKIKTPLLMLQSGMDLIVKPGRQNAFCEKAPSCKKIAFPRAHHEILQETDEIRDVAMKSLRDFFGP